MAPRPSGERTPQSKMTSQSSTMSEIICSCACRPRSAVLLPSSGLRRSGAVQSGTGVRPRSVLLPSSDLCRRAGQSGNWSQTEVRLTALQRPVQTGGRDWGQTEVRLTALQRPVQTGGSERDWGQTKVRLTALQVLVCLCQVCPCLCRRAGQSGTGVRPRSDSDRTVLTSALERMDVRSVVE